jgi:hypothetical protein
VNDADIAADVAAAPAARHWPEAEEADNSDGVVGLSRNQVSMAALDGNSQTEAATELKV